MLVWSTILVGTGLLFFVLGRQLWRQSKGLVTEVGVAGERLGAVMDQVDALGEQVTQRRDLAVFADPVALRRQHAAEVKQRARDSRRRHRQLVRSRQPR
jgi:hypothetical protein